MEPDHQIPDSTSSSEENNEKLTSPKAPSDPNHKEIGGKLYAVHNELAIKAQLHTGTVIEDAYIESLSFGDLQEDSTNVYPEKILIKNCVIERIDFSEGVFEQMVHFEKSEFNGAINIGKECNFKDALVFESCNFRLSFQVRQASLPKGLKLANSRLMSEFHLEEVDVKGDCIFVHSNFEKNFFVRRSQLGTVSLRNAVLSGHSHLQDTHFHGAFNANSLRSTQQFRIQNCVFEDKFCGEGLQAGETFQLNLCRFLESVKFDYAAFQLKFVADACIFEKFASFSKVNFHNVAAFPDTRFEFSVAFGGATFHKEAFFNNAFVTNSTFNGTHFMENVNFERLQAKGEFLFYGVHFHKDVEFTFCQADGRVSFSNQVVFDGKADFYRGTFRGAVWFLGASFKDVSFANTTFEAQVFFNFDKNTLRERNRRKKGGGRELPIRYASVFNGETNFTNTLFYRKAVFENVFFRELANFENAHFGEETTFENAHFLKGGSFKGSFCTQELNFTRAVFDEYVNFDLTNINRRLNLTDTNIDKGISFYHAVIDVVVVEKDQISGRLMYEGEVPGKEDKQHYMRVKEEYLILKESFNQRGKFDEEDWAYYRYRVNDRKSITEKAWRSLQGKQILAVQDDIPTEETEDDAVLLQGVQRSIKNAEKKLGQQENRLVKLKQQEEEILAAESQNPDANKSLLKIRNQMDKLNKPIDEQQEKLQRFKQEEANINAMIEMNHVRLRKVYETKEKPYAKMEAVGWLFKNIWWKLVDWGTGYGMKPYRIAALAFAVIILFGAAYHVSGEKYPGEGGTFFHWVHFSAMAFTTSNPEGDIAYSEKIKFLVMSEAMLGLFLLALFVGCYTRKIIR